MASSETPAPVYEPEKVVEHKPEVIEKAVPPLEVKAQSEAPTTHYFVLADVILRFLLFASAVIAVVVMVTSNQTKMIPIPFFPFKAPVPARFHHSAALIYFVAALSVAGLYALITTLFSFFALLKPGCCTTVFSHFVIFDVLLLGVVAAATGAGGAVGYIGLKGNSHVGWAKVCNRFDIFCRHVLSSLGVSLFGSIVLTLLVLLSIYSLSRKIPK